MTTTIENGEDSSIHKDGTTISSINFAFWYVSKGVTISNGHMYHPSSFLFFMEFLSVQTSGFLCLCKFLCLFLGSFCSHCLFFLIPVCWILFEHILNLSLTPRSLFVF